jgi:hypothetical protein
MILSFSLVLAACTPTTSATTTSQPVSEPTTSLATAPEDICAIGDLAFTEDGLAAALGEDVGDAAQIETIRWDGAGTCERVTIEFTTQDGAPATTLGPTGVSVISFSGIVRVVLPAEVATTAIADSLIGGNIIGRVYVVRLTDDTLVIDIHGVDAVPITARAVATASPASLVIDVSTNSSLTPPIGVTASAPTVVLSPVPGPNLYPITVEGYASPSLRSMRIQLSGDDEGQQDRSIALGGDIHAWQAFRNVIPDGPSGNTTLFVGTIDANDRPDVGAIVSLDLP